MLEKLLEFIFPAHFDSTSEREEYRNHLRRIAGPLTLSIALLFVAMVLVMIAGATSANAAQAMSSFGQLILGLLLGSILALLLAAWNGYALYRFQKKHGAVE